jgi:DNA-binding transcriptional regulator GbsR (MarR family)
LSEITLGSYGQLVRFFEKQGEWLGLPRNTGPVLASLYLAKYESERKLAVEEICKSTNYSRSNVGLILSQLEALGLVYGEADFQQTGRGRRRILYSVDEEASSLMTLGIRKMIDRLEELIAQIDSLMNLYQSDAPHVIRMLSDLKKDARESLVRLSH